ncbi:UNVERIFIED_ORG: hypothetical protein QOE_4158 [Clostridioides difficile F501]
MFHVKHSPKMFHVKHREPARTKSVSRETNIETALENEVNGVRSA